MLELCQISIRRGPRLLFQEASLQAFPGQRVGVTGANGTGKSSLFAAILGELHTDAGDIKFPKNWVAGHVAQESPAGVTEAIEYVLDGDEELRAIEASIVELQDSEQGEQLATLHAKFQDIQGYSARGRAGQLLHGLGFSSQDESKSVGEFSGGWRVRLNLAKALMCRSDLLLLDEPTNHLDLETVIWLEDWLRSYKGTLLLISHDREFLDRVTTHIANIEHQSLTLYSGNYSSFEKVRAEQLAHQQAAFTKQQREIAHIHSYVERFRAKATKARQAQSRLKALARMEQIAPAHVDSPFHFSLFAPEKLPSPLLKLTDVDAGYDDLKILADINLMLEPGSRIGLLGANGAGKSTLIKLLAAELSAKSGKIIPAQELKIGYFAQHQLEQLHPEHTPLEHMVQLDGRAREQQLRDYLGGFGFVNDQVNMPVAPFSGGEKSRLALALLVYQRPNLLLLDEPTNHLDIEMRQALAQALQEFDGGMVLVSHDRHLIRMCCDQLVLVHDGKVEEFEGSLDDYPGWLADRERGRQQGNKPQVSALRKDQKRIEAEERKRLQPLRKKVTQAEVKLEKVQNQREEIDRSLADTELYLDENKQQLKTLLLNKAKLDSEHETLEMDWLDAFEQLEAMK